MKRLLGLVGITYLAVQAAVFYFYDSAVLWSVLLASILLVAVGLGFRLFKRSVKALRMISVGITAFCAVSALFLFQNNVYDRIVDNYSEKEINVAGYICEEIRHFDQGCTFTVKAEKINGENADVKLSVYTYNDYDIEEFDKVRLFGVADRVDTSYYKSKGIFLRISENDNFVLETNDEKHFSLYSAAVSIRKSMKSSLDSLLSERYSSLCKAILLGDKQALSDEVYDSFIDTGISFMIVVSGLHLNFVVLLIMFLTRNRVKNRVLRCAAILSAVFAYTAITGFTPSVVRAAVTVSLTYTAKVFLSKSDGITSLGAAALLLCVSNPFICGDVGVLLSFSSTMGILLWAQPLSEYLSRNLKNRILIHLIQAFSVSVSGSLWAAPLIIIFFGRISPFTVLLSVLLEIPVAAILITSLAASLLSLIPFVSFLANPFALIAGLLSKFVLFAVSFFSGLPFSSVKADRECFYIWIAVSVVLVVVGYLIHAKPFYIKCAASFSAVCLVFSWSLGEILADTSAKLVFYNFGSGITVSVSDNNSYSLVACGGNSKYVSTIKSELEDNYSYVNNIIIPNKKKAYLRMLPELTAETRADNVFLYSKAAKSLTESGYDLKASREFFDGTVFTVSLCESADDTVICSEKSVFQYLTFGDVNVLVFTSDADISNLPERYRTADYLLTDKITSDFSSLSIGTIVVCGDGEIYSGEDFDMVTVAQGDEYIINGGKKWQR